MTLLCLLTSATQTSMMTPKSNTVLLNSPRGYWLAMIGKEAESHLKKDVTHPIKSRAGTREHLALLNLTPQPAKDLCLSPGVKNANQDIPHTLRASFPQGIEALGLFLMKRGKNSHPISTCRLQSICGCSTA